MSVSPTRQLRRSFGHPALPGIALFAVLWLVTALQLDMRGWATQEIDGLWQSLGAHALRTDPFGSLSVLHIQPPGLNALYAVDQAVTTESHGFLFAAYFVMGVATLWMLADGLVRSGVSRRWSMVSTLLFALLPATVIYALWPYVVTPVAMCAMAAVYGVALLPSLRVTGALISMSGVAGLALIRPSFVWPLVLVWAISLTVVLWRRGARPTWSLSAAVVVPMLLVLVGQLHYATSFGLVTMTSWSGENLAKALSVSRQLTVTDAARQRIDDDPCLSQMLVAYEEDRLNRWDPAAFRGLPACAALPPLADRGAVAWDSESKADSGEPNFNASDRLVASRKWTELMTTIVSADPTQLVRMAVTSPEGPSGSGLALYLSAPEQYPFVDPAREVLPTAVPLGIVSIVFAPAAWVVIVLALVALALRRVSRRVVGPAFWFAVGLAAFHLVTNVLFEFSENMRYQAEIDAVLMFAAAVAAQALWSTREREVPA